jgi:hypothetical protein
MKTTPIEFSSQPGKPATAYGPKWEALVVAAYAIVVGGTLAGFILRSLPFVMPLAIAAGTSAAISWFLLRAWKTPVLPRRAFMVGAGSVLFFPFVAAIVGVLGEVAMWSFDSSQHMPVKWPWNGLGAGLVALIGTPFALVAGTLGGGLYWLLRRAFVRPDR